VFNRISSAVLGVSSAVFAAYGLSAIRAGAGPRSANNQLLAELGVEVGVIATLWIARSIHATWRKGIERSGGGYWAHGSGAPTGIGKPGIEATATAKKSSVCVLDSDVNVSILLARNGHGSGVGR
jgi:hypothetical protein